MPTDGEPAVAHGSALAAQLRRRLAPPFVRALDSLVSSLAHQPLELFLVGGVVRDLLDTPDLSEQPSASAAAALAPPDVDLLLAFPRHAAPPVGLPQLIDRCMAQLERDGWKPGARVHGDYGTAELQLQTGEASPPTIGLDLAVTRTERYAAPGLNPEVQLLAGPTAVDVDLGRRDVSINAMALSWPGGSLRDPFGGQADLTNRQLRFLHGNSISDDPSRIIRAARYGARLGLTLAPASLQQLHGALAAWPWRKEPCPPALGSRLGMELELLFAQEPWLQALRLLQGWRGFRCIDWQGTLQRDHTWQRRLHWAARGKLPLLPAFLLGAEDPLAVARRLQLPVIHQRLVEQVVELRRWLLRTAAVHHQWPASDWTAALEGWPGAEGPERIAAVAMEQAVELAIAGGQQPRGPLLRWARRWRHVRPRQTAQDLMAAGVARGPALGQELRRLRAEALDNTDRRAPSAGASTLKVRREPVEP